MEIVYDIFIIFYLTVMPLGTAMLLRFILKELEIQKELITATRIREGNNKDDILLEVLDYIRNTEEILAFEQGGPIEWKDIYQTDRYGVQLFKRIEVKINRKYSDIQSKLKKEK
jgi:hypothetical protein